MCRQLISAVKFIFISLCITKLNSVCGSLSTGNPTTEPTREPTSFPTCCPTLQPTGIPSTLPTGRPTGDPSMKPTRPTSYPTTEPTSQPSGHPSRKPSGQRTSQPSQPSREPTKNPSRNPSEQPSGQPTSQPTGHPTYNPTVKPTLLPSGHPTGEPSGQPQGKPSGEPSAQPSGKPTGDPTRRPSIVPSSQPSEWPTNQPSVQPTMYPSKIPSGQPTTIPTLMPTLVPTGEPSKIPSGNPTNIPSSQPSLQPSDQPSSMPSDLPSDIPSVIPTRNPSSIPSVRPIGMPTIQPSRQPTSQPSRQPTFGPTSQPTSQPLRPSHQPSGHPTDHPSDQPTRRPTSASTISPSVKPSTAQPTKVELVILLTEQRFFFVYIGLSVLIFCGLCIFVYMCITCGIPHLLRASGVKVYSDEEEKEKKQYKNFHLPQLDPELSIKLQEVTELATGNSPKKNIEILDKQKHISKNTSRRRNSTIKSEIFDENIYKNRKKNMPDSLDDIQTNSIDSTNSAYVSPAEESIPVKHRKSFLAPIKSPQTGGHLSAQQHPHSRKKSVVSEPLGSQGGVGELKMLPEETHSDLYLAEDSVEFPNRLMNTMANDLQSTGASAEQYNLQVWIKKLVEDNNELRAELGFPLNDSRKNASLQLVNSFSQLTQVEIMYLVGFAQELHIENMSLVQLVSKKEIVRTHPLSPDHRKLARGNGSRVDSLNNAGSLSFEESYISHNSANQLEDNSLIISATTGMGDIGNV